MVCLFFPIFYTVISDLTNIFLLQSVATIGSTLTSVQHDVKTMQSALENQKKDDDLKETVVNLSMAFPLVSVFDHEQLTVGTITCCD